MKRQSYSPSAADAAKQPPLLISLIPILFLLAALITILVISGADAISGYSPWILLAASALGLVLSKSTGSLRVPPLIHGMKRSARQILPAVPLLLLIASISATWMWSGVVPTLIKYGVNTLSPMFFLAITCGVCAAVSVLTGSSWTTIATIGVAFMGVGQVMGYTDGWIAGAIISGAYFGDKVSPLSDTTVIASSSCGVDLFDHIRNLMTTAIPAMLMALTVYSCVGIFRHSPHSAAETARMAESLGQYFNLSAWTLVIPGCVFVLIVLKVRTLITLAVGTLLGVGGMCVLQPQMFTLLASGDVSSVWGKFAVIMKVIFTGCAIEGAPESMTQLLSTGGIEGMLPTIVLILSAMVFGGVMLGTGMLAVMARWFTSRLSRRSSIVGATVGSGLFLNSCTADQYLSIIIGSNMYRDVYQRYGFNPKLLSRTLEDSVSVTSVLIPWNSCGVTQSTVLGVATLAYMPFCVFNYMSPVMSIVVAWLASRQSSRGSVSSLASSVRE